MLFQKPRSDEIQHFAYLYLHIFHWKCWRKTQDHVVCFCFHDLKCQGTLEGSINLTVFPQTNYSWIVPRLSTLPLPRCQQMVLLLNSLRKRKQSEGVIPSPPSQGSNLPMGPEALPHSYMRIHLCSLPRPHSQLKDVLPAIVSSLSCLNSSQAAEGGLLGPSGQAPWLGCGSLPKVGAPFALSE